MCNNEIERIQYLAVAQKGAFRHCWCGRPYGIDREHLLQYVSGRPIGDEGGQMSLKLIQFRRRPGTRWPVEANLDRTMCGTAESGKPHRYLTEKRGYRVIPIVRHVANAATAWAIRPSNGVALCLRGDDHPVGW